MIAVKARTKDETRNVRAKAQQGSIKSLGHAGAAIRLQAKHSIRKKKGPSPAGQPPHTHTRRLPRAIKYAVEKERGVVVIGTDIASLGTAGKAHELGGKYKRQRYPRRPFMRPALEKTKNRLPRMWANSVR